MSKTMKKPVPKDFNMTTEEYQQATEQLNTQNPVQVSDSLVWFIIFISILMAILIGIGIEWAIKIKLLPVREGLGPWIGVPSFFFLIYILGDYFNNREERNLRKELSKPIYRKVELYENALRRYQQRHERYWKSLRGIRFENSLASLYSDIGYSVRPHHSVPAVMVTSVLASPDCPKISPPFRISLDTP